MKHFFSLILLVLLTYLSAASVDAEDNNPAGKQVQMPSLLTATPQTVLAPTQRSAEASTVPQSTRLGHVDLARVAAESETGKTGQLQLIDLKKKLQGQIETKRKQLDKQKAAIEEKLKSFTAQQREAKAKEFQKKVDEFQKFGMNAEKELQVKQEEFSDKLFKAIEQASADLGKAKGLALVVIKRELLYLSNGVDAQDVTEDVIKKIDKK